MMKASRILALAAALVAGSASAASNHYPFGSITFSSAANTGTVTGYVTGANDWLTSAAQTFTFKAGFNFNAFTFSVNDVDQGTVSNVILGSTGLSSNGSGVWSLSTPTAFSAGDNFLTIKFETTSVDASFGGSFKASVSPVPEPETYAMMLAGLGAIGFMARRKKSA